MDQRGVPTDLLPDTDEEEEPGLLFGRPVEDRSFETVELAVGAAIGFAIGALFGPAGAVVGLIAGGAIGAMTAEVVETLAGGVATTTDTSRHHHPA